MSFNENLKEAMFCKNVTTRRLSALTGIKVDTINSYLKTNGSIPPADKALKIASSLDVSVNFLVNGFEVPAQKTPASQSPLPHEVRRLAEEIKVFDSEDLNAVRAVVKAIKRHYE